MRLLQLRLLAFGPFTNVEIDLAPRGVQVIYGRNEAGKSTTLRAIAGLLYGIPKSTPDAHLHKMPELRIGGIIADENGRAVDVVRRKGRDNTLLDRQGQPVDEAVLARLLGGVGEEHFFTMFGLHHASLRDGGTALLQGGGNVGESLFGAAMAGGELHQVLRSLRDEADALFTPKAHTRPLNEAIRAWSDAHKRTRVDAMSHESVDEQQKGLTDSKQERRDCENERRRLQAERTKLERASRALPILSRRRILAERRATLGPVVLLPGDSMATRVEHQRIAADATREIARLEEQTEELSRRLTSLVLPEALVKLDELPDDIVNRLGSQRKANRDLPRIEAEVEESEAQAHATLRRMGRNVPLAEAEAWRVDAATQATIRKLDRELGALETARRETRHATIEKGARHASLVKRHSGMPPASDTTSLRKAVSRAEREGPLDQRMTELQSEAARLAQVTASHLSSLGLGDLSATAAAGLALPSATTVDRFARDWAAIDRDFEQLTEQRSALTRRLITSQREIDALELIGKVPTERDLSIGRQQRDDSWRELRKALEKPASTGPRSRPTDRAALVSRYEEQSRAADDIADRLRREAERVSRLAVLVAERQAAEVEQLSLQKRDGEQVARKASTTTAWRELWQGILPDPQPPIEMKEWLDRHAMFVGATDQLQRAEAEISALDGLIDSHCQPLLAQLVAHHAPPQTSSFSAVLDAASELVETLEATGTLYRELTHDIAELETELVALAATAREQEAQQTLLVNAWRVAVTRLGFDENASPEEANAAIELLAETFQRIDAAESNRRRVASIKRDAQSFAGDVDKLTRDHAPDLLGIAPEDAAAKIIERFHEGKAALARRREIERQLGEATSLLAAHRDRRAAAEDKLQQIIVRAGVTSLEALEEAERRSEEAARFDEEIARLDALLHGQGGDADSLQAEFEQWDTDTASSRLADVSAELDELHDRTIVVGHRILSYEEGLRQLDSPGDKAAQAALEAESALARVRDLAERYLTVRIASVLLGREIERYRQENQGPILARASELFFRLTLGSFSSLKVDFDEEDTPVLLGVRSDGRELLAPAMSDGTRDQLFLALRIATLERYAEHNDPLPLVVDDILVHFDDERAKAALEVLGDLSQRTQVLFFTHHARLVGLAETAIHPSRLSVRTLGETPNSPAPGHLTKPSPSAITR